MNIAIINGRLIDPKNKIDTAANLYVSEGQISAIGEAPAGFAADRTIDASGCIVCPGLVDLSARLSGLEGELAAAVAGGVTTVVRPPDTNPPLDEPELVQRLIRRSADAGKARVLPLGALTKGLDGERLAEMAALKQAGSIAFSQANRPVMDTQSLLRALEYAATFGYAVWLQPEDHWLARNGVAHDGEMASRLGLAGIPVAAETIAIATLLQLAAETGVRLHLTRISSAAGMAMIEHAHAKGAQVTCDVGVHHLHLTELDIGYFDAHARFDPPLRSQADRAALSAAVARGSAAICSDHTPMGDDDKLLPFGEAKPGATGLEMLLPLTLKWAEAAGVALPQALARITSQPAAITGSNTGHLSLGTSADVCVFDPTEQWLVTQEGFTSRGRNSPFIGYAMQGKVRHTLVGGEVVYSAA